MAAIKAYRPEHHSLSQGQVLSCPYSAEKGALIIREMADQLVLDLVRKGLAADQIVLHIGYDHTGIPKDYKGILTCNHYGKQVPKSAHGSVNLGRHTASAKQILAAAVTLYRQITDSRLLVRRLNITANHVIPESECEEETAVQYGLFDDVETLEAQRLREQITLQKERRLQDAVAEIKQRYGNNAILKGMNFLEGATTRERNGQVGGHRA